MTRQFDTLRCHIERYQQLGYNLIPIKYGTKEPLVPWKEYQKRKSTFEEIQQWFFGELTKKDFHFQFYTFMIHYLRHKLREKWFNKTNKEWASKTMETLYEEPWCYREWHEDEGFPTTTHDFLELLISKDFLNFITEHIEEKATWGWTKLFDKKDPKLINLIQFVGFALEKPEHLKDAMKTCKILWGETKKAWLVVYPSKLRTRLTVEHTVDDVLFRWVILKDKRSDKLTALDVAGILKLNLMTCRRTAMPTLRQLEPLLADLGIQIAGRGEG